MSENKLYFEDTTPIGLYYSYNGSLYDARTLEHSDR